MVVFVCMRWGELGCDVIFVLFLTETIEHKRKRLQAKFAMKLVQF